MIIVLVYFMEFEQRIGLCFTFGVEEEKSKQTILVMNVVPSV